MFSINDGQKKLIGENSLINYAFSPTGKYLVYYDPLQKNYFTYEISSGLIHNLTDGIQEEWSNSEQEQPNQSTFSKFLDPDLVGWTEDDNSIIIRGINDIYQINIKNDHRVINLTGGLGNKKGLEFQPALERNGQPFKKNEILWLIAFDHKTKQNGFYKCHVDNGSPEHVIMSDNLFYRSIRTNYELSKPIKAKDCDKFVVIRMSATESPNFYFTTDFKSFLPLSHLNPEKSYNWYTAELHTWTLSNFKVENGILYKPENFDPCRKYPTIFYFYETLSDCLNLFQKPAYSDGSLNIAWYVSNGFLVFTPDIHYKFGQPGKSALESIESAAKYLLNYPFVDGQKLGIQGVSFGGYETNFIITHSKLFAAACSAVGKTDLVSNQGALNEAGNTHQGFIQEGQFRMDKNLWESKEDYISNSPIFFVDRVETPLLILENSKDVNYLQGLEFFSSLRRLGKKSWMLDYENSDHGVAGRDAEDFTVRLQQFYNHYLKNKPAPQWMIEGIPNNEIGLKSGLELDRSGRAPGSGLLYNGHK